MKAIHGSVFGLLLLISAAPAWAICAGMGDDTAAVQALVDAGHTLPAGRCMVSSLNMTNRVGPRLIGQGIGVTVLVPVLAGANLVDLSGAVAPIIRDISIGDAASPLVLLSGILGAPTAEHFLDVTNGVIDHVLVDGRYTAAALLFYGRASDTIRDSTFSNRYPGEAAIFTSDNPPWLAKSVWATVAPASAIPPASTESDTTITGSYFWQSGATNVPTIVLRSTGNMHFFGGSIAGIGSCLVMFQTAPGWGPPFATDSFGVGYWRMTDGAVKFCGEHGSLTVSGGGT